MGRRFDIYPTKGCGTHVHVSSGQWKLDHYKRIAKAIIGCEAEIDARMAELGAEHRNEDNEYCKSNSKHSSLQGKELADAERDIENVENIEDLVGLLCGPKKGNDYDRDFKWNLTGLLESNRCTIEFRQPPACQSADDAVGWVRVTTEFLEAAAAGAELDNLKAKWSTGPKH